MANALYDPTTLIGKTRLHAADTDITTAGGDNATFSDIEITYFLSISSQDPILAAAFALEALAADQARLANQIKIGQLSINKESLAADLRSQAQRLRENCNIGGAISAPDAIFTTDNTPAGVMGSMDRW